MPPQRSQHPLSVPSSERHDIPEETQIVVHDSGKHGQFLKSDKLSVQRDIILNKSVLLETEVISGLHCIYRWEDQDNEDAEYLWLGYVVSVEGSPVSPDCKLTVRWCPNSKKREWRTILTADDTFDLNFTSRLRQPPYRDTIEKKNCVAINLHLTAAGKFDNKHRFDDGSTSKEVARSSLLEFYNAKL